MIAAELLVLPLAAIGAHVVARGVIAWADQWRMRRDWARSTEYVTAGPWLAGEPIAAARSDIEAEPQAEPDLSNRWIGTDEDLLNQLRDMWKRSPGGEDQ